MSLMSWIRRNVGIFRKIIVLKGIDRDVFVEEGFDKMVSELVDEGYDIIVVPDGVHVEVW